MSKIRLRFSKTGSARFISHLDLMRTMKRAFLRAGIDLKYTQGFNPHPYMSVALPLPVGCGSVCELLDVELLSDSVPDGLPDALTRALPRGIRVLDAYLPERKFAGIARVRLEGLLVFDNGDILQKCDNLAGYLSRESIIISKKSKSGVAELDIAPHIGDITVTPGDGCVKLTITVSAQNPSITPNDLLAALTAGALAPDFSEFTRIGLYDAHGDTFS